jgi:hypothetical protein
MGIAQYKPPKNRTVYEINRRLWEPERMELAHKKWDRWQSGKQYD